MTREKGHSHLRILLLKVDSPSKPTVWEYDYAVPEIRIGRPDPDEPGYSPDLNLDHDHWVSRRHASLHRLDDAWVIRDLGSKHGTFVDDVKLRGPKELKPGSLIKTGSVTKRKKYVEFSFKIYSPIRKRFEIERILLVNLLRRINEEYYLRNSILRNLIKENLINTSIHRKLKEEYKMNQKLNNEKLMRILEEL